MERFQISGQTWFTDVWPNQITGANAGGRRQLPMRTSWAARVVQFCRSAQCEAQSSCAERSAGPDAALANTLAAERCGLHEVSRDSRLVKASAPSDRSRATCSPQSGNEMLA